MSVPDQVRESMRQQLWTLADQIGWISLTTSDKSRYYDDWTKDPAIGGILSRYISQNQVRVYLKDTLLKDYSLERFADENRPFRVLQIPEDIDRVETYKKPHGRRLADGRIICWGRADDWKTILMALHERAFGMDCARPYAAVFLSSLGRFHEESARLVVQDAATKLGIERVIWLDT